MERANREKGEKKEYIDLSDVEADSEDYRYYDDESNPRRFDKGYGPSRQLAPTSDPAFLRPRHN
jgi:hypothetical protein